MESVAGDGAVESRQGAVAGRGCAGEVAGLSRQAIYKAGVEGAARGEGEAAEDAEVQPQPVGYVPGIRATGSEEGLRKPVGSTHNIQGYAVAGAGSGAGTEGGEGVGGGGGQQGYDKVVDSAER